MERKPILVGLKNGRITHLSIDTSNEERMSFINDGCDSVVLMPENSDVPDFKSVYEIKFVDKATPEGFVLVPKECPDPFFADNLFADLKTRSFICDGEEFINLCDIDPIVVWKMVIEAQEQSHELD